VTPVRAVLAGGLLVAVVALAVVLLDGSPRQAGSNYVAEFEEAQKLRGGREHCQAGQVVPRDAAALRLLVGTYGRPAPAIDVEVTHPDGPITSGRRPAGGSEGHLVIPLDRVDRTVGGATVCVRIGGRGRNVLYGQAGNVRLEYLRQGSESWIALAPTVAHRFGLAKANPFGSWLIVVAVLLLAGAWFVAVRTVARESER
jgi:hypothetical protein